MGSCETACAKTTASHTAADASLSERLFDEGANRVWARLFGIVPAGGISLH